MSVTESMNALQMPGALLKAKRGNQILWLKIFQVEPGYGGVQIWTPLSHDCVFLGNDLKPL